VLLLPKFILDELTGECRPRQIFVYITIYAIILVLVEFASFFLRMYGNIQSIKAAHCSDMYVKKKWLYMDYSYFEDGRVRDLAARCVGQVDPTNFIERIILGFFVNLFQIIGYAYIIISFHPSVLLVLLAIIMLNVLTTRKLDKIGYEYQPLISRISRRLNYVFNSMVDFDVGREVRINGASTWLTKKFENEVQEYIKCHTKKQKKQTAFYFFAMLIDFAQNLMLYGYCGYLAIMGDLSVGSFSMILGSITLFLSSSIGFINRFSSFDFLSKYVDEYREFLSVSRHKGEDREINVPNNDNFDIKFENVSFKYPNTERYVLKNVSFTIKTGERVSIVGYNGAGKTTLIKLLCRFYEPTEGRILVGGIDISTIPIHEYRKLLSVVFQDHEKIGLTIRDNIVMDQIYDEGQLRASIVYSGLADKIASLENGVDTMLFRIYDYDAIIFSGGENQKLACARAYYKNAPIVILDEPTAALDPIAEARLYERFNNIVGKKTSIYISHRLASSTFCDSIAVFANGELVEHGSHEDLMLRKSVYADMYCKQAQYYV
jgi:ATP-binding cassette subfamily C protein